jgi:uncharacterized membrane protein
MTTEYDPSTTEEQVLQPTWPGFPTTSTEFITLIAHYYRAEIARMAGWRDRIDRTSNWAITVVGAMLSVSLSTPTAHHGVILFAMILVLLLLVIESRRYRFFDVYRTRVRRLERNYFAKVFSPTPELERNWTRTLSDDLRNPSFLIGRSQAISRRLRRNYCWMFLVLFSCICRITIKSPQTLALVAVSDALAAAGKLESVCAAPWSSRFNRFAERGQWLECEARQHTGGPRPHEPTRTTPLAGNAKCLELRAMTDAHDRSRRALNT